MKPRAHWLKVTTIQIGALVLGLLSSQFCTAADAASAADIKKAGQALFEKGVTSSGAAIIAKRADGSPVTGQAAACANCHRPSGMGMVEGDIQIPPITGRYLFPEAGDKPLAVMDPRIGKRMSMRREPHTNESLAVALRDGIGSAGTPLNAVMPRYQLSAADLSILTAYVKQLSNEPSPGIEDRTIRFATVITPGVEPQRKAILLEMLRVAMMQKNGSTKVGANSRRHMVTAAEMMLGTENKWAIDVWELTGPSNTWGAQLKELYKQSPPFALISGLGNGTWAPIEDFCEQEKMPCWFPSIASAPARDDQPKYSFYYSRGLTLEAQVLAKHFLTNKPSGNIIQIVRSSDGGKLVANDLVREVNKLPNLVNVNIRTIDLDQLESSNLSGNLNAKLVGLSANDLVVSWLRPKDLADIAPTLATSPAQRFASGSLLSGNPNLMPESIRKGMQLVYPYAMTEERIANLGYMHVWLKLRRIPLVDEPLQSEVYFAVNFLTDTIADMLDNLYREYLVERAETMIAQREARKAEDEVRDQGLVRPRVKRTPMDASIPQPNAQTAQLPQAAPIAKAPAYAPGYAEHAAGLREGTTIYPRLTLGPGQRYASKGAYIVKFVDEMAGAHLLAVSNWIVP
jgi:hypothetical protein